MSELTNMRAELHSENSTEKIQGSFEPDGKPSIGEGEDTNSDDCPRDIHGIRVPKTSQTQL